MSESIGFIFQQLGNFYNALSAVSFSIVGVSVTLTQLLIGFICMSIIISFFWKGARG